MLEDLAAQLRREFDGSFSVASADGGGATVDLLALRLGDKPYAVRLDEIKAVVSGKRLAALPGSPPELLGLAGFRGELVPVYDLGLLLGHEPLRVDSACLVLTAALPRLGLAFAELEAYLRVAPEDVIVQTDAELLKDTHGGRPILRLAAIRATITERVRPGGLEEEHP